MHRKCMYIYINVYVYNILGNEEWKLNMQFCKKLYRYNNSSPLLPMMTEKYEYLTNSQILAIINCVQNLS